MKPSAFNYFDPATISDALGLLARQGDSARVLAGGQSLMPMINYRQIQPQALIDINLIEELHYIREDSRGLTVGATVRQRELERLPDLAKINPLIKEALPLIGHFQIRNRGTVCGSLAHADPAAQLPAVALTVGASLTLAREGERRAVDACRFFIGPMITAARQDELLAEATFPRWNPRDGWAIEQATRRRGDFALVGVMTLVTPLDKSAVRAQVTVYGAGSAPQRVEGTEEWLAGKHISSMLLDEFEAMVRAETRAVDDFYAPARYRQLVAGTLARRALVRAAARAGITSESLDG